MYIVDTNILLRYPKIFESKEITITIRSLEELDGLKKSSNSETAFNARRASRLISKFKDNLNFIIDKKEQLSVDDEIVYFAKKKRYDVYSNDVNVQIKCYMKGINCLPYEEEEQFYSGIKFLSLKFDANMYNPQIEKIINTKIPPFEMRENEYLIISDSETEEVYSTFRYSNNEMILLGKSPIISNAYNKKIIPKNQEQKCLFDLLQNDAIKILIASGLQGSGKSFCLTNFALQQLEKGKINKIVWVPNNSYNQDSRELGTLPGNLYEKELPFLGTLVDIVGEIAIEEMLREGKLEIIPISIMRGRNISNSIIIVNEAQNLTEEHIKLLVGRGAENTRIFFDGDIKQADNFVFKNKNGLNLLLKLSKSEKFAKIFGTVRLNIIERSFMAQVSDYLDSIDF